MRGARDFWRSLHLALALTAGTIFVLAGLTGSVLVYYLELDALLNPALAPSTPAASPRPLEDAFAALRAAEPARDGAWRLEIPAAPGRLLTARYYAPAETAHRDFAPLLVTLDPATLEVRAVRLWGRFAMTWIYDLHYTLLLDRAGRYLLGACGVLLLLGVLSGLRLWWPRPGRWRAALRLWPRSGSARGVYDLHQAAAIHGLPLSLMLLVTGVALALPELVRPALAHFAPLHATPALASQPSRASRLTLDAAVAIARREFPGAALAWVETPQGARGVFRVNLHQPGEPSRRFPRTNVWLDQYSGRVLARRDGLADSAPDRVLNWLHPLHNGEAFGAPGRVLVCVAGLLPAVLFVTGVLRWRQKAAARRRVNGRRGRTPEC
jgi:uncharacterized iron-regulated membrane protein